jgi:4-amino-4-deoxy-L-arabinose transferase-like glycosyltransferase
MRRGGPWFIPTLQGHPRLSKPPLAAWLTAAAARPDTVRRLSTRDPGARAAAFRQFAWQVRWPTLLCACGMLLATYALGDLLLSRPAGILAALACGSSLMFLRFSRSATTDVQLALWVTATNGFLAYAVLGRFTHGFLGYLGAGVTLGLALMSKGPVGFVQTLVPIGAFLLWRRYDRGHGGYEDPEPLNPDRRTPWALVLLGVLVMLAIALPWPAVVMMRHPHILPAWWTEITREGATQLERDPWYFYLVFFVWMPPMLPFLVAGMWVGAAALAGRRIRDENADRWERWDTDVYSERMHRYTRESLAREGLVLAVMLTVVPIVVMSFFKDKPERYLLPMAPPAAIVAAGAAVGWFRSARRDAGGRVVDVAYWTTLIVLAVGGPLLGALAPRFNLGAPWFSAGRAAAIGTATLVVVGTGFFAVRAAGERQRGDAAAVLAFATGAAVMLLLQYPVMRGYSRYATSDLRPLADAVWEKYPDAELWEYEPGTRTRTYLDLPIYAGRLSRKVNDLSTLRQTDRPQVVVFFEGRRQGAVQPDPPWQELMSGGGRKNSWHAYVLPAAR